MGWNYLSIPKLQRCNRWSLGMDKLFHSTLYNGCDYISMLGLKLICLTNYHLWIEININVSFPLNTWCNNNVVTTSKRRHFDVITSKWRRFDVITTSLLRNVFAGLTRHTDVRYCVWLVFCCRYLSTGACYRKVPHSMCMSKRFQNDF